MPKFDFESGTLNNIKLPVIGRSVDLNRFDLNSMIRTVAEKAYTPDAIKSTGPYKAVVLRVEKANDGKVEPEGFLDFVYNLFKGDDKPANSGIKQMTQIKARIPELHAHLPLPTGEGDPQSKDYQDHYIIDMYPTFTSESDRDEFSKVKPGDIVIVDFVDKKNMTDPVFITPIAVQQHMPSPASGQGAFNRNCAPPSGMMPGNSMGGSTISSGHAGVSSDALRARSSNASAILFGDSQMQGSLGKALADYIKSLGYTIQSTSGIGSGGRMHRAGSPLSAWIKSGKEKSPPAAGKWDFVSSALRTYKPELVVICLGGNGVGKGNPTKLLKKIRSISSDSRILWIGPPPAAKITRKSTLEKGSPWGKKAAGDADYMIKKRATERNNKSELIKSEIGSAQGVYYINTYKVVPDYIKNPGPNCDGIHMTKNGAIALLNSIKKKSSPAAAGTAAAESAQKKPKHPNKTTSPGAGSSDPKNPLSAEFQTKNKELLLKVFDNQNQKWENLQGAQKYLKEKAEKAGEQQGSTDIYDSYLNRDWVSGYLLEDGHVKAMSVDTSVWEPARNNELASWSGFTSYPVFAMGKNPYGATIQLDKKFIPGSETASVPDNNPMGNKEQAAELVKQESYVMGAAAYTVATGGKEQKNPAEAAPTAVSDQNPPCPTPMGNAGGGGTFDPSGPIQLPPDGVKTFIPLIEDAINNAVKLVAPLNMGISSPELKLYLRASCMVESGGKINAINKYGYSGLWQWGGFSWRGASRGSTGRLYKQATGKAPPPFIRDYNYALSPYVQALFTACSVASKIKTLKKLGAPVTSQHIYMIHNQGAGGFSNIWRRANKNQGWGGTLKGKPGDFRRAWANGCKKNGLGKAYKAGTQPQPWTVCTPKVFYEIWTKIWKGRVARVSKPGNKGGASTNSGYISRMAHNTNVGTTGFKADSPRQRDSPANSPGGPANGGPPLAGANVPAAGQWRKA